MSVLTKQPDLKAVKGRQQVTWSAGDYGRVGATILLTAELLCEAVDPRGGQRVLDVAAGNGNAALAAARRFCNVTATDHVPALLDEARAGGGRGADARAPGSRRRGAPLRRCLLRRGPLDLRGDVRARPGAGGAGAGAGLPAGREDRHG